MALPNGKRCDQSSGRRDKDLDDPDGERGEAALPGDPLVNWVLAGSQLEVRALEQGVGAHLRDVLL